MQMLVIDNLSIYLLFTIIFIASIAVGKTLSGRKISRVIAIVFASSVAIIISTRMILQFLFGKWYLPVGKALNFINHTFFDVNKTFPIIFCFVILLFIMIAVFLSPEREKLFVLYCIGMVSAGVLAGSTYLGARIFSLAIFMIVSITTYIASTIVFKSVDLRKAALLTLSLLTLLGMEKFFFYGEYVRRIETIRLQLIESYRTRIANGLTTEDEWLVLPAYSADAVNPSANPGVYDFHMGPMKRYYNLPDDANVIIDTGFAIKAFTTTQVNGSFYRFEVSPLHDVSEYTYTFVVRKNARIIYKSAATTENFYDYEFPGKGTYTVSCVLSRATGHREVSAPNPVEIGGK